MISQEIDDYINKHYYFNPETEAWEIKEPLVEGGLTGPIKFSNKKESAEQSSTSKITRKKTRKKRRRKKKPL